MSPRFAVYLFLAASVFMTGCDEHRPITAAEAPAELPTGATEITEKGNGWLTFRLDGRQFLYHRKVSGSGNTRMGFESVTELTERPADTDR